MRAMAAPRAKVRSGSNFLYHEFARPAGEFGPSGESAGGAADGSGSIRVGRKDLRPASEKSWQSTGPGGHNAGEACGVTAWPKLRWPW
jgi:hypothetical protein